MDKKTIAFVLVHGIYDTSSKLRFMQTALENQGYHCVVPSLMPNDGSKGLEYLAKQLHQIIDDEISCDVSHLCLVGFSMGGLIGRYYLQQLGGYRRIKLFFSISAPHHGSYTAYFSNSLGARQMRPNSEFLRALQNSSGCLQNVPCYSFWTPLDAMILPASSSLWEAAQNIKIMSLCHPLMARNKRIVRAILQIAEQRFTVLDNSDSV